MTESMPFTEDEMQDFTAFCVALTHIVEASLLDDEELVMLGGKIACRCGRKIPAGLPGKRRAGERRASFALEDHRVWCPACVRAKDLLAAVNAELNRDAVEMTAEERASYFAIATKPKTRSARTLPAATVMRRTRGTKVATGIDATIDRLHGELESARTGDERTRIGRLLEAAERARDAGARI